MKNRCVAGGDVLNSKMPQFKDAMENKDSDGRVPCYYCGRMVKPRRPMRNQLPSIMLPQHNMKEKT